MSLRKAVIRLAHSNPELRPSLLPLLRERHSKRAMVMRPGSEFEDESKMLRFWRGNDSFRVTDLTNAGKRGKVVDKFAIYMIFDQARADALISEIIRAKSYKEALKIAKKGLEDGQKEGPLASFDEMTEKGVHVTPAGFRPIKLDGEYVSIRADYKEFTVLDKEDQNNLPALCQASGGKKFVKVFYRWVKDHEKKLKTMHFRDVTKALMKEGIKFHQWCRMD